MTSEKCQIKGQLSLKGSEGAGGKEVDLATDTPLSSPDFKGEVR
jgi:hypothetical protein